MKAMKGKNAVDAAAAEKSGVRRYFVSLLSIDVVCEFPFLNAHLSVIVTVVFVSVVVSYHFLNFIF